MRNHGRQIEFKLDGILRVGLGVQLVPIFPPPIDVGVRVTRATLSTACSGALRIGKLGHARTQIVDCHFIEWKHTCERAPFGSHVGDRHPRRHRQVRHAVADKLNGVIEHFIFVEETAQRDDDIFTDDAG